MLAEVFMAAVQASTAHVGRGKRRHVKESPGPVKRNRGVPVLAALGGLLAGAAATWALLHKPTPPVAVAIPPQVIAPAPATARSLSRFDLLAMTPQELAKVDLAEMNLV